MITDPREKIALRIEVQADGCWTWDGPRLPAGYGRVWHGGKHWLAHRLSYESFVGPIPDRATHCRQGHPRRETPMGKWYCPTCRSRTKRSSK